MTRIQQSREELERHLAEQIGFLEASAAGFDQGNAAEAKRLALHIRTLVHDRGSSRSLLGQLGLKESISFVDGGARPSPRNLATTAGLTMVRFRAGVNEWVPKFVQPRIAPERRVFAVWWTRPVLVDDQRQEMSRQDIILALANTDGGAHVDPALERVYHRLSRQNSIGWIANDSASPPPSVGVEHASTRQVAWELLETLRDRQPVAAVPIPESKTGRNDPCSCGSGKKYKKCHGA